MPTLKELRGNIPFMVSVPYVAAASGATAGGALVVPFNARIISASFVPAAAITGQATNFITVSFFNRGAAGAGTAQWATARAYSSGAVTDAKGTPTVLTLSGTAADLLLTAGDNLTVEVVTTGTGLAMPGGVVNLVVQGR